MPQSNDDHRSPERRAQDNAIAAEPPLAVPDLSVDAKPRPIESHLPATRSLPKAVFGIVENGLVRPLDASVKLLENSRVIIVSADAP